MCVSHGGCGNVAEAARCRLLGLLRPGLIIRRDPTAADWWSVNGKLWFTHAKVGGLSKTGRSNPQMHTPTCGETETLTACGVWEFPCLFFIVKVRKIKSCVCSSIA